ncbi:MAG: Nif11-like leader peptide family natural product precursor [Lachnospiraceae bacterium]|nr:Nif11-like leader peptide family natural product precursor [Lachnospiraceae bacterium]
MNLVGDLKEKVETAESKEEAKQLIQDAGVELTEEEMEQMVGGLKMPLELKTRLT